ncbi:MAG: MYXO-CTERM sorting domain-containing protein [Nannocystaceae bacterium]|nr:MYXO-CTERM sorting domain-containing protein [Nannocystaceae bacterium]
MKKIALMVGVVTALVGSEAHAETDTDNFNPQTTFRPNEFPWTSGPISLIFGVSVEFTAAAYHEVDIEMIGQSEYDFDSQTLNFTGDKDGGVMENALGVEVGVVVAHTSGLSFDIGIYNIEETADGTFSPYLLPGDIERPFGVNESIGPNDLVDTAFTLAGIPITIDIDWVLNVPGIEYQSLRIELSDGEDSVIANEVGVYDAEDDDLDLVLPDAVPGETSSMYGTLHGELDTEIAFVFIINATVSEVPIGPVEVPLDYPVNEGLEIVFPVELISFDVPLPPEPGTSTGADDSSTTDEPAADSSGGDSDSDSDGTTTGDPVDPSTSGDDGSSGGGLPAAPSPSDAGCGCTTNTDAGGFAWLLGLFGLTVLRRRRD